MFESSGVTEQTLTVYRALLQRPSLMEQAPSDLFASLAGQLGIEAAAAEAEVNHLRAVGLIVPRFNAVDQEYPIVPAVGFKLLADRQQQEIDRLMKKLRADELSAETFTAGYKEYLVEKTARDVELLESREAAYQRMQHFRPERIAWALLPPDGPPLRPAEETADTSLLDRGIDARWLIATAELRIREVRDYCRYLTEHGAKVRTAPSIPMKLLIFDDAAVMGIDPDDTSVGAVVHHSAAVVRMAKAFFEYYWRHATDPFATEGATGEITPQERELLQLLVQGATDDQAGRKLGVSLRTIRRMAAKLGEQVGASGRFELGVRAAQRGWVR